MARRTLEVFECDICGKEGERYTILYPDGQKVLDRCDRHNSKVLALREEKGEWQQRDGRSQFKISTPDEIMKLREGGN